MKTIERIYLLGESAAAGYLYAPEFTPAKVLQHQLRSCSRRTEIEVVDLTRTSETLAGLVRAAEMATAQKPDALVIFAGNNWTMLETPMISPYVPDTAALRRYGDALATHGVTGPVELGCRFALEQTVSALEKIRSLIDTSSTRLVLVVPEVNLRDWQNRQPVVWLEGGGTATWYRLYSRALHEYARDRADLMLATAREMCELDGATCPTSFRLEGLALLALGELEGAESALRSEIEANQYATLGFLGAPQADRRVQKLLRRLGERCGARIVDLPRVFATHTDSIIPDRRLFLDYCHLTSEGVRLAMAAVTAALVSGDANQYPKVLERQAPFEPTAEADASAKLGAAVHTAHRMGSVTDNSEILEYWCREALLASPGIADSMLDLIDTRTSPCPAPFNRAQVRNQQSDHALGFQQGWRYPYLDSEIIRTLLHVLDERRISEAQSLIRRRAISAQGTDLVWPPSFLERPVERFYPEVMPFDDLPRKALFRAAWPCSYFSFVSNRDTDLIISIIARRPRAAAAAQIRPRAINIEVAGRFRSRCLIDETWTRSQLRLPRRTLDDGLNTLRILWPMVETDGQQALATSIERLQSGFTADIHPVFGEIFELRVEPSSVA